MKGMPTITKYSRAGDVLEVALLFLRLGLVSFGGPAAHTALMREEVVGRKKWMDDQQFLDFNGITNLIPGPNSTEMAIHIGYLRAGWPGLIVAGASFILPAMIIVIGLAWLYVRYSTLPDSGWLLYGIKPVVIAIIIQAIWVLSRKAIKNILTAVTGGIVLITSFLGINPIFLLLASGGLVMLVENFRHLRKKPLNNLWFPLLVLSNPILSQIPFSMSGLFLTFVKIGAVLYGSGYVLVAYLQSEFVNRLGWLTTEQVLNAITIGQITPGPVLTTATFIGYLLAGPRGAIVATVGIFLPAFIFVAICNPFIPRLRNSSWAGGFLDGVNAASLGLMSAVTWTLGRAALVDILTVVLFLLSSILLIRFRINSTWLILGGALVGLAKFLFYP
jgi:chromate transporter